MIFLVEGDADPETYTSTPKSSYKPLAAPVIKTPFVPLPKRQQQQIMQQQQQQQLQANSLYSRDTYSNDGKVFFIQIVFPLFVILRRDTTN